ncbi:MAG: helix-turn-helix domain-containing protein [Nannocystaceae bacterium]|nr:TetR/AcrR family transcriptional regulator [Myxococcales bacterium]
MARPAKHDDEVLLARAMEQFWSRGYEATSIRDLEEALELRAPAIYRRFESKDALFARVVDRYVSAVVVPRIERYLGDDADDPIVALYRFFRTAQSCRGCLLTNTAVESAARPPAVRRRVRAGLGRMRRAMQATLERADVDDPARVAEQLLIAIQGLMVLSRAGFEGAAARGLTRTVFRSLFPAHPAFAGAA